MTTTRQLDSNTRLRDSSGTLCNVPGDAVLVPGELVGESAETGRMADVMGTAWDGTRVRLVLTDGTDVLVDDLSSCTLVTDAWRRMENGVSAGVWTVEQVRLALDRLAVVAGVSR